MEQAFAHVARRMAGVNVFVSILDYYVARRIFTPFFLFLVVLLMVFSLERLLRLAQIVSEQKAFFFKALELLFYLLPHYLGLAVPAALFLAALIALRRLHEESELVVMQGAGLSPRCLYRPVMALAVVGTFVLLSLSGFVQPHARYAYRVALHGLSAENPLAGIRAGVFRYIGEDVVLYVERIDASRGLLQGVFISSRKMESGDRVSIAARVGKLEQDDITGAPVLLLKGGNLVRESSKTKKIDRLVFDVFPWQMPGALGELYGARGQDEREMTLIELQKGGVAGVLPESSQAQRHAEFHKRLVQALSLPFLVLWALPLALVGRGRGGKALGLVPGVVLLILYEKILGLGEAYAAKALISPLLSLWGPWIILGLGGVLFARWVMPEKVKGRQP